MHEIIEILKYTIPSLVVFVAAFFIMKKFMDNEYRKVLIELKKGNMKTILPIRLQAYERSALFLERINMDNLIKRITQPKMTSKDLHVALINAIRTEYEHNLSQQIYMSNDAWDGIKKAKEETLKIVHMSMAQIRNKGGAMDLATCIFKNMEELKNSPSQIAISIIKKEVKYLF